MDYVKDKFNQATENIQGKGSKAQAEGDKKVVKGDTNAGPGARATAAGDYVVDKKEQKFHERKADVHDAKSESR